MGISDELLPYNQIDQVPIQLVVARDDTGCPIESARRLMDEIPAVKTMLTINDVLPDHYYFAWNARPNFMEELIRQIELDPSNYPAFTEGKEATIVEKVMATIEYL